MIHSALIRSDLSSIPLELVFSFHQFRMCLDRYYIWQKDRKAFVSSEIPGIHPDIWL